MRVDPRTGQPHIAKAEAVAHAAHEAMVAEGETLAQDLTSGTGLRHIQDMLDDYQRLTDQLMAGKAFLKAEVPKEWVLAQMDYIQGRLRSWNLTVQFGRLAREKLVKELDRGMLHGGPASAD